MSININDTDLFEYQITTDGQGIIKLIERSVREDYLKQVLDRVRCENVVITEDTLNRLEVIDGLFYNYTGNPKLVGYIPITQSCKLKFCAYIRQDVQFIDSIDDDGNPVIGPRRIIQESIYISIFVHIGQHYTLHIHDIDKNTPRVIQIRYSLDPTSHLTKEKAINLAADNLITLFDGYYYKAIVRLFENILQLSSNYDVI